MRTMRVLSVVVFAGLLGIAFAAEQDKSMPKNEY